jgi:hypothetical protein
VFQSVAVFGLRSGQSRCRSISTSVAHISRADIGLVVTGSSENKWATKAFRFLLGFMKTFWLTYIRVFLVRHPRRELALTRLRSACRSDHSGIGGLSGARELHVRLRKLDRRRLGGEAAEYIPTSELAVRRDEPREDSNRRQRGACCDLHDGAAARHHWSRMQSSVVQCDRRAVFND